MLRSRTKRSILPGFGLTMGYTVLYLSLIVLLPLVALVINSASLGWSGFWAAAWTPRAVSAYRLTFATSLIAAVINALFGLMVAWTLVRYRVPGKKLIDAMIDLPFALPTAVSGIALATVYSPHGWIGQYMEPLGIQTAFSPLGITIALVFIGLPFVVRTVQPAIEEIDRESEEAAASLGATRWQTFRRVIMPAILPALLTGFALSFARALGEYGSVVFISGNKPGETEIASLLIMKKLEQFDYPGATAIATIMLAASFVMLLSINVLQWWSGRKLRGAL
ncbi:MAG: sulfate ABC transporter permease subunit CysT [Pirellulales bacterium]